MKRTGFYIIKEKFFEDMSDPFLKGNNGKNRPHYYCFEDTHTGIYWMIPLSSVFLIQYMFPITEEYIEREYTIAGNHLMMTSEHTARTIEQKAKKVMAMLKRGVKFTPTQPDVVIVLEKLVGKK